MQQGNKSKSAGNGSVPQAFDNLDWQRRMKEVTSGEEFTALIEELPTPVPRYKPTDTIEFTDIQITELRNAARSFSESQRLEKLPWDEAWAGKFPRKSTVEELDAVLTLMEEDAIRILKFGFSDDDYSTEEKHCRMIYLEGCKRLDL